MQRYFYSHKNNKRQNKLIHCYHKLKSCNCHCYPSPVTRKRHFSRQARSARNSHAIVESKADLLSLGSIISNDYASTVPAHCSPRAHATDNVHSAILI